MVLARTEQAAAELSRQIREGYFEKEYLAVVHGCPDENEGRFCDLLVRNKARRMTFVATEMAKGVQPAALAYCVLNRNDDMSRVRIRLETGRTHQIRVQFSSRGMSIAGDGKYGSRDRMGLALWSSRLSFRHPIRKKTMAFNALPDGKTEPWDRFSF
jgi:23S rRNA pseudouridine1911/1915/1917 synthase